MIVPILKKNDASSYHRLEVPLRHMESLDESIFHMSLDEALTKAEIVIFNRVFPFDIIELLRYKKKYGFKIIADIDDYWILPPRHMAYRTWRDQEMTQRSLEAMMNADFVFASTKRLANRIEEYNKKVEVIPNGIPFGWGQFTSRNKKEIEQMKFIYAGGNTHLWDIKVIQNCVKKLDRDKVGGYFMYIAGYDPKDTQWKKMESMVRGTHYMRGFKLPLDGYMVHYEGSDVSLAPLEENYFNSFKSNLKLLEAGCKYIPLIASNFPPYSDEPNNIIIKTDTTTDWYKQIRKCIENPQYVKDMGDKTGEYVRQHYDLFNINQKRKQIFNYLLNK